MANDYIQILRAAMADVELVCSALEKRSFPGEQWLIGYVSADMLLAAQSMAGELERQLNDMKPSDEYPISIIFRTQPEDAASDIPTRHGGKLSAFKIDQLIQLLEARSRTSDALPSLKYVEDPRASLAAVAASRHYFIYGRRGVGKTALLLEAKRLAERQGDVTVWLNAHTFRHIDPPTAYLHLADAILKALIKHGGSSHADSFERIRAQSTAITELLASGSATPESVAEILPTLNGALRPILRESLMRLDVYVDDFYFLPMAVQPEFLDYAFAMLRDCDAWLKVASIERLTRTFDPSSKVGLEIPHDASKIDLDRTLEDPVAAQAFLEHMLTNYTTHADVGSPSNIAKRSALGRLVLASGGVPRDYLNLFASSIVQARITRPNAQEVGTEDVTVAANGVAQGKKRDLGQDVASDAASPLLSALDKLSANVKDQGYSFFRVNLAEKADPGYEILGQLVDLRFVHLIQATLSDQHKGGMKYEAYVLDLSEYSDVRIKRGLHVLELEDGEWYSRLTGTKDSAKRLTGSLLRDYLRQSPLVSLKDLRGGES